MAKLPYMHGGKGGSTDRKRINGRKKIYGKGGTLGPNHDGR
jgi:hypothetical protein